MRLRVAINVHCRVLDMLPIIGGNPPYIPSLQTVVCPAI